MTTDSAQAKRLLKHYLEIGFQASNYRWDSDNTSEVDEIVDSIIAAATSTPTQPAQPDALTRIAVALERIANRLDMLSDSGTDWNGDEYSVLRTQQLR